MTALPNSHAGAQSWAHDWISAWNARDLDAVLAMFTDDCEFRSPKAAAITGNGTVHGKPALEAYWREALTRIGTLRFMFEAAVWDPESRALVIRYVAELGAQRVIAAEIFDLDGAGKARRGTAVYGAPAD
ncbi:MAG: nuclear transport factor 2 family protein [Nevskia sp.]